MHHPKNKACVARFALSPVALVAIGLLQPFASQAQGESADAPQLKPTPRLREDIPAAVRAQLPTFVEGDEVRGRPDLETIVEGDAELRRGDTVIRARRIEYTQPDDLARASGNVHINKAGNIFEGPLLELKVDAFEGFFNEPRYRFLRNDAYGQADRIDFVDDKHAVIRNATYTTCQRKPGPSWMPDWILRAASISLDQEEEVGQAKNAVLSFMGLPILPVPSLSFPLGDGRKSGVLPPTFGIDNKSGVELTLPYYWNIAPNRDATLYPTLMSKRGVDLGAEFRYLEPTYNGLLRGNYLAGDRLRDKDRWGFTAQHSQSALRLPGLGVSSLSLNLNRVSDDDYWRDFSRNSASLTQRLLSNDAILNWSWSDVSLTARMLRWQTLQDLTDTSTAIIPPYNRSPQFTARQTRANLPGGVETYAEADYTHFTHSIGDGLRALFPTTPEVTQPNAHRSFALLQVSRPWQAPGWFVVPKAQVHTRHYNFDRSTQFGQESATVTVPTLSLDSGLVFERATTLFGRRFVQTLEPRAFYVYTPFRDQNRLPNYDSGLNDFNFATVYTENAFGGNDRIADNNLLTLGAATRLLDPDTGAEAARFAVAQRLRFQDQRVTLPGGTPVSERLSDILFGASINLVPQWSADTTIQFNPKTRESIRETLGVRYSPGNYRVVSAAYRLQRATIPGQEGSEQIDIGWQWPLNDLWGDKGRNLGPGLGEGEGRWYSVGRMNVSLKDKRIVDGVLGLEYDAGCWLGRIVVERLQAGTNSSNKRILFQLEFVGFSRLGSNALQALKENIPRYQYLRERSVAPSRFSNYD
ncbi:LPS-assembly protein LptD [Ramlibacter alkalitolerans]|uniref:LPS-assembly protein LptD n=1 Tax=Ramlibacter alkalitolerans TaxID=2039631 RepID=A0ABS1JMW3_9BURK|nr:LPS-assembly protein LptD [Ramlibacter alkalitolerans]MBL0425590.1 LPS-assembly protein LptD [Ramlibacter alkalitolerans]